MKKLLLILFIFLFIGNIAKAITATAVASGNWSAASGVWSGGSGLGGIPGTNDSIVINTGVTVTLDINYTTSGKTTILGTGTLIIASTYTYANSGKFILSGTASLTINSGGTVNLSGTIDSLLGIVSVSGIMEINNSVTIAQLTIANGGLWKHISGTTKINNGSGGSDVIIQSGGRYQQTVQTLIDFQSNASTKFEIQNGGVLEGKHIDHNAYPANIDGNYIWNHSAVFEMNPTASSLVMHGYVFFPGVSASTIPIYRLTAASSIANLAGNMTINGIFECNRPNTTFVVSSVSPNIIFRNGIRGTGNLTLTYSGSGSPYFGITGTTAVLEGTGTLTLPKADLHVSSATTITLTINKVLNISTTPALGTLLIEGTMNFVGFLFTGTANVNVVSAASVSTAHTEGFSTSTSPNKGSIQVSGIRTFSSAANYEFTGSATQVTGDFTQSTTPTINQINNLKVSNTAAGAVTMSFGFTAAGTTIVNSSCILGTAAATFTANGAVTMNGTFKINQGGWANGSGVWNYGTTGTLYYNNTSGIYSTINTDVYWPSANSPVNVTIPTGTTGVNVNSITRTISGTFTLGSTFQNYCNITFAGPIILTSGYNWASGICGTFSYTCASTLTYNANGIYSRGPEWTAAVTPGNVVITNNTEIRNNGTTNATICGSLTIDAGSKLYMDYSGANGDLTVGKNVNLSGNLSLGTTTGDLYIGGNWTHNSGTFTDHAHAVFFNGSIAQTITNTIAASNNTETFTYLVINNTHASGVNLATGTDVIVSGSTGDVLQLINSGPLNLNGDTLTLSNLGGNILVTGATRTITGIAGSTLIVNGYDITNVAKTVTSSASGKLLTDVNVKIQLTGGIDFGSFLSTINGTLQINTNGYVKLNAPVYGSTSFLIYYNGALGYKRNYEWSAVGAGTIGTTPGYPNKIIVDNNTPVDIGDASVTSGQNFRACADSLTIRSGSSVTMNNMAFNLTVGTDLNIYGTLVLSSAANGDLFVGRSWKRTGTFTQNGRNVTFNGTADGTLTASGGQLFSNVYLDKSASAKKITLQDNVDISNELGLTRGTIDLADKNITFLSTATSTARLAPVITPANIGLNYTSTGRFVVQRYIPAKRAWRLLTAPYSEITQTISEAWQEGGQTTALTPYPAVISNPAPTYGTHVTGGLANNGNVTKGFDAGPNSTSIYAHSNATNTWSKAPSGTKLVNIDSAKGWMLFVRGDRTTNLSLATGAPTNPTTLRTKGKLNIGAKTTSSLSAGFSVIGNPYPSAISFDNVVKTNINNSYYLWDANVAGAFNVGGWVTFAYLSPGVYTRTINSGIGSTNIDSNGVIQSGAAFMVYSTGGSGSITINETDKKSGSNNNQYRPVRPPVIKNQLRTSLYTIENGTGNRLINDGNVINFDPAFCNCIDTRDAVKPANFAENFGIMSGGQKIAIERKGLIHQGDTIQFDMWKMKVNQYQLEFAPDKLTVPNGTAAFLEDNYLNSKTPVHLNDTTRINFSITSDAASAVSDRFRLLFVPSVVFTAITANKQHRAVKVGWEVSAELNIREYDIERSTDGIHFIKTGTVPANGNSVIPVAYHWLDDMPVRSGNLFYRIRSISNNDIVVYSDVARVKNTRNDIFVNDENIKTTDVSIAERNKMQSVMLEPGKYRLKIFSANGQLLGTDNINWSSTSSIQIIVAQQHLSRGLYLLEIFDKNKLKAAVKVFAE